MNQTKFLCKKHGDSSLKILKTSYKVKCSMTDGIDADGTINFFNFGSLYKDFFLFGSFGQLLSEEIVGNDELQENVIYMKLENIEVTASLIALEKRARDWLRAHLHRKRESFNP